MSETVAPFIATQLTIVFHEEEDRLVVLASSATGAQEALLLTRRLTARLINGIAGTLEKSNVLASTAPNELRNDIVLMEHQSALAGVDLNSSAGTQGRPARSATSDTVHITPRLVSTVKIKVNPTNFDMVLQGAGGEPTRVVLNRNDLHRLLELLTRQAEGSGWNLQIDAVWLGETQSQVTIN